MGMAYAPWTIMSEVNTFMGMARFKFMLGMRHI